MDSESTTILMFHRVTPNDPVAFGLPSCYRIRGTALTADEFGMALDEAGRIIPLAAIEDALTLGESPPPGAALTFDDGYREHLEIVAPILVGRGVAGTFYVTTGVHGAQPEAAVVDAWYWLIDHAERAEVLLNLPEGEVFSGRVDTVAGKTAWVVGPPKAALLGATAAQQRSFLAALADAVGVDLPASLAAKLYLRPDEWGSLRALGMRVGAHSVSHPRLTEVPDDVLAWEVEKSIATVRGANERPTFAYPDGAVDERVVGAVRCGSVGSAVTCEPGDIRRSSELLRLPRRFVASPSR